MKDDQRFNVKKLLTSAVSLIVVLLITYYLNQPDPKGIGFGLCLIGYGVVVAVLGMIAVLVKSSTNSFFYYFIMMGNGINVYLTWIFISSMNEMFFDASIWSLIAIINLIGAVILLVMFSKILRSQQE